ncbi:GFA family protein, partial [Klebsiella pneumoniae]
LCKAVTYTADVEAPLLTGYDHCDDCQRQSGSTYCTPTNQNSQAHYSSKF